jgi:CRISPR/Cas system-associated protein Csm6
MEYINPELFNQARLKTKLSNKLLISKLSDEDLNKMMVKHEEKDKRYQKFINETTERNTEILNQIYYEQERRKKRIK